MAVIDRIAARDFVRGIGTLPYGVRVAAGESILAADPSEFHRVSAAPGPPRRVTTRERLPEIPVQ
jgi:hypothetical protein